MNRLICIALVFMVMLLCSCVSQERAMQKEGPEGASSRIPPTGETTTSSQIEQTEEPSPDILHTFSGKAIDAQLYEEYQVLPGNTFNRHSGTISVSRYTLLQPKKDFSLPAIRVESTCFMEYDITAAFATGEYNDQAPISGYAIYEIKIPELPDSVNTLQAYGQQNIYDHQELRTMDDSHLAYQSTFNFL